MKMKIHHKVLRHFIALFALSWATATLAAEEDTALYFVQHSFYADRGKHITTNYHLGTLIPINTLAKITDMGSKKMVIELPDLGNMEIKIENAEKHTQKSIEEIKSRMFGTQAVDLKKFSTETQEAIKNGQIILGMTKEEVLLAYGYPPAHATANLELNQWNYWKTRWNRIVVDFQDGKVKGIRD
ncbi:MAG: hypothetical protein FD130_218 [Halothiobacillaceae bacterium]|nr:MAG: hypothetical protein FD130_218 [Halothiobacillaceae bacterium]